MSIPLRLLLLEDEPKDAQLVLTELGRNGFAPLWQCVETEQAVSRALELKHAREEKRKSDEALQQREQNRPAATEPSKGRV